MATYTLDEDNAIRGDQLEDEIRVATGATVQITFYPPRTIQTSENAQNPAIAAVIAAHRPQAVYTPEERGRGKARQDAQSAVGATVQHLSAPQSAALLFLLLSRAGALDESGAIRPLEEWA